MLFIFLLTTLVYMKINFPHNIYIHVFPMSLTLTVWAQADPSYQTDSTERLVTHPVLHGEKLASKEPPGSEMTQRGRNIRGVYVPVSKAANWKPRQLAHWVKKIGADAVILDIKDDRGRVTFTKKLRYASKPPHSIVSRMEKIVHALKEEDIYVIGRLVCFKDNLFYKEVPEAAIRDRRTTKAWRDVSGAVWLDPYSLTAHEYIASIAAAAADIGFDEIQLDYVRFPVDPESRYATYSNKEPGLARHEAIALLLARVDFVLSIPLSIDVFGLTSHRPGDSQRLGQSLEHLAPYIDAISPMLYLANWPKETWENASPKTPYEIVFNSVKRIKARLGSDIVVRPLLQGFKYRAANFGISFMQTQIDAALLAGSSGYLFWNQAGSYSKVAAAWRNTKPTSKSAETVEPVIAETTPDTVDDQKQKTVFSSASP